MTCKPTFLVTWAAFLLLVLLVRSGFGLDNLTVTLVPNGTINGGLGATTDDPSATWTLKAPSGYLVHSSDISPDEGIWTEVSASANASSHIYRVDLGANGVNSKVGATVTGTLTPIPTPGGGGGPPPSLPTFTANALDVDLDSDSDNDGTIIGSKEEDEAEDAAPGVVVFVDEVQPLRLTTTRVPGVINWSGFSGVELYANEECTNPTLPTTISPGVPVTIYAKGIAESAGVIVAQVTPNQGNGTAGRDANNVTVKKPEWRAWPGGHADTTGNPIEKITSADMGLDGLVDWTVDAGATIVETDPAGGAGGAAQDKNWIKVRYNTVSPDATEASAVKIVARGGGDANEKRRTVFSVTWSGNFDGDLARGNHLKFPTDTGRNRKKAEYIWQDEPWSMRIAGKMEATMSFTPIGIDWVARGVDFVYGNDEAGTRSQCRFAREHERAFARQDSLGLTREFPPFIAGKPQQFTTWTTDGAPDDPDTQYPRPGRPNDKAFNLDAPGGNAGPSTLQVFIREVFRNFMQWHDGTGWQRMGPYYGWHFNASGRDTENNDRFADMIADLPNEHGAGNDPPTPMENSQPTCSAGINQVVTQGQAVSLPGSATDADTDVTFASNQYVGNALWTWTWTQTQGAPAMLTGANTATASFTAPNVDHQTVLKFRLTVKDGTQTLVPFAPGNSENSAEVQVTVNP